ncbi:MAG TPA: response regulator transcription factor [Lachnospiraceae bacterium]|nr:response regulator transcription factor [Lachnospiraceae bacterium]
MQEQRILIIEDEKELAQILGDYLEVEGYTCDLAFDGVAGLHIFHEKKPNLILLDIMLPKIDGIEVCKRIREESDIPILILSAKNGEMDKVISLGIGADDYVTKPFSPLELVARVKAHLRRYQGSTSKASENDTLQFGKIRMCKDSYEIYIEDRLIELTTKEFEVLYFFASHINQVFSKEQIYEQVWGMNEFGDISSVAVYIKRIRRKLEEYGIDYIKTVWGIGYKLSIGS